MIFSLRFPLVILLNGSSSLRASAGSLSRVGLSLSRSSLHSNSLPPSPHLHGFWLKASFKQDNGISTESVRVNSFTPSRYREKIEAQNALASLLEAEGLSTVSWRTVNMEAAIKTQRRRIKMVQAGRQLGMRRMVPDGAKNDRCGLDLATANKAR